MKIIKTILVFLLIYPLTVTAQDVIVNPFEQKIPPLPFEGYYSFVADGLQELESGEYLFSIKYLFNLEDSTAFYEATDSIRHRICIADENFNILKSTGIEFLTYPLVHHTLKLFVVSDNIFAFVSKYELGENTAKIIGYDVYKYDMDLNLLDTQNILVGHHTKPPYPFNVIINNNSNFVLADFNDNAGITTLIEMDTGLTEIRRKENSTDLYRCIRPFFQADDNDYYLMLERRIYGYDYTFTQTGYTLLETQDIPYFHTGDHIKINGDVYLGGKYEEWEVVGTDIHTKVHLALHKFIPGYPAAYEMLGYGGDFQYNGGWDCVNQFTGMGENHLYVLMFYSESTNPFDPMYGRIASFKTDGTLNWEKLVFDDGNLIAPESMVATLDSGVILQVRRANDELYPFGPSEFMKLDKEGNLEWITGINEMLLPEKNRISLSSNPFYNSVTINSDIWTKEATTLSLYDIKGSIVTKKRITKSTIELPDLVDGIYIYTIRQQGRLIGSGKLVREGG